MSERSLFDQLWDAFRRHDTAIRLRSIYALDDERTAFPVRREHRRGKVPFYQYACEKGHTLDVFESMSGDGPTECPDCRGPMQRVIQPVQRPIVKGGTRLHHGTAGVK